MSEQDYMEMLMVIDEYFQRESLVIRFSNGLVVNCISDTGIYETGAEPDDYVGEFATVVKVASVITQGSNCDVQIYNDYIEISLVSVPSAILSVDGTVLWQR
ncbi:MAG: hypothetical protein FWC70_13075 [Defluviitaleaceae bacterium]|nr:hypothetical protein [Defluviitaleaceae bacterium]